MEKEDPWANWQPEYGNASRPGLLSDEKQDSSTYITVHKQNYKWPVYDEIPYARRREMLKKFISQQVVDSFVKEMAVSENLIQEKDTTYRADFRGDGFEQTDLVESADPEVTAKYPLYTDQARSVYFNNIKNIKTSFVSYDPQAAFRKCSHFSKPFYAELE